MLDTFELLEEDVLLLEAPDEGVLLELPDEDVLLLEVPDEDVLLFELLVEDVLLELPDEDVPLELLNQELLELLEPLELLDEDFFLELLVLRDELEPFFLASIGVKATPITKMNTKILPNNFFISFYPLIKSIYAPLYPNIMLNSIFLTTIILPFIHKLL